MKTNFFYIIRGQKWAIVILLTIIVTLLAIRYTRLKQDENLRVKPVACEEFRNEIDQFRLSLEKKPEKKKAVKKRSSRKKQVNTE